MKIFRRVSLVLLFCIGYLTWLDTPNAFLVQAFSTRSYTRPIMTTTTGGSTIRPSSTLGAAALETTAATAAAIDAASSTILQTAIINDLQQMQWDNFFTDTWFNALFAAMHDSIILMSHMPLWLEATILMTPLYVIAHLYLFRLAYPPAQYRQGMEPYPSGGYDPVKARRYYAHHPVLVARRLAELLRLSGHWLFLLLAEKFVWKNEPQHREERAQELLDLITKLGSPTFVKIAQALSVRTDILPEEYTETLSTLQDKVPPFDSEHAKRILRRELGPDKFAKLQGLENGPVASASIGQVYKCRLDGRDVAVKVQRPGVLAEIALDLYLARELAPWYRKITGSPTDFQSLANEWGRGFIAELSYLKEAENTMQFNEEMQKRKLTAVCAPQVVMEYTTDKVLVTEWVEGTRIDQSPDVEDIPRLCSVALNAYLVMLLETSKLHSDPHPGNLIRTTDGRLCILDFGMVLDIDPSLQYALLEYVAHLTSGDYDHLPEDMAKLGFLRPDKVEFVRRTGVLEPLKYFLKQMGEGGGANQVKDRIIDDLRAKYPGKTDKELRSVMRQEMEQHFQDIVHRESVATGITVEIEELQRQNEDAFKIPEWFVYCSRAFLTLEGVSLAADENYSIIKSCFPYIAKRLIADSDPRAAQALRDMLYGASNNIDVDRIADLAGGFSSFTSTTKSVTTRGKSLESLIPATGGTQPLAEIERKAKRAEVEASVTLAKDSADILLNPKGNTIQNLLVEESVLAASARFKDGLREAVTAPEKFRKMLPLGMGALLPPLPFENHVRRQLEPFIEKTVDEEKAIELADKISQMVTTKSRASRREAETFLTKFVAEMREMDPEEAAYLMRELRENLPKYAPQADVLGKRFFRTLLQQASTNIESTLDKKPNHGVIGVTAKGLSKISQQGAKALNWHKKNSPSSGNPTIPPTALQIGLSGNSTLV